MAASIDQQFIEYIVKSLVGKPDAVSIERTIDEKGVLLSLSVDPEDLGRVIGKRGATAQSLRTLLRALGTKNEARYNLKIIDTGSPEDRPPRREEKPEKQDDSVSDTVVDTPAADPAADDDDQPASTAADDQTVTDELDEPLRDESTASENETSDLASRTRAELADLDDLDV